jgi:uncharacterized protein YmfQ (DUF2313 family)
VALAAAEAKDSGIVAHKGDALAGVSRATAKVTSFDSHFVWVVVYKTKTTSIQLPTPLVLRYPELFFALKIFLFPAAI